MSGTDGLWSAGPYSVFGIEVPDITRVATGDELDILNDNLLGYELTSEVNQFLVTREDPTPLVVTIEAIEKRLLQSYYDLPLGHLYYIDTNMAKIRPNESTRWVFGWSKEIILDVWKLDKQQRKTKGFIYSAKWWTWLYG